MVVKLKGYAFDQAGVAKSGVTIQFLDRNTSTVEDSTTTDSNGKWEVSNLPAGRYDVKADDGGEVYWRRYDDQVQLDEIDVGYLRLRDIADRSHTISLKVSGISADQTIDLTSFPGANIESGSIPSSAIDASSNSEKAAWRTAIGAGSSDSSQEIPGDAEIDARIASWARVNNPEGQVPDARLEGAIARDSEIISAIMSHADAANAHHIPPVASEVSSADIDERIASWARANSPQGSAPISRGGTGAVNVSGAQTNLGVPGNSDIDARISTWARVNSPEGQVPRTRLPFSEHTQAQYDALSPDDDIYYYITD